MASDQPADQRPRAYAVFQQGLVRAEKEGMGMEFFADFLWNVGVREIDASKINRAVIEALLEWDC